MPGNEDNIVKDFKGIVLADEFYARNPSDPINLLTRGGSLLAGVSGATYLTAANTDFLVAQREGNRVYVSGILTRPIVTVAAGTDYSVLTLDFANTTGNGTELPKLRPSRAFIEYISGSATAGTHDFTKSTTGIGVSNTLICNGGWWMSPDTTIIGASAEGGHGPVALFQSAADTFVVRIYNFGTIATTTAARAQSFMLSFSYPCEPLNTVYLDDTV